MPQTLLDALVFNGNKADRVPVLKGLTLQGLEKKIDNEMTMSKMNAQECKVLRHLYIRDREWRRKDRCLGMGDLSYLQRHNGYLRN